jgi:hypothetical protein
MPFFFTFTKIVQFLKPQSFDLGTEFEGGGRGKRKGFFSFWNLVLWQGYNSHVNLNECMHLYPNHAEVYFKRNGSNNFCTVVESVNTHLL